VERRPEGLDFGVQQTGLDRRVFRAELGSFSELVDLEDRENAVFELAVEAFSS
jgi:hypothetical protein